MENLGKSGKSMCDSEKIPLSTNMSQSIFFSSRSEEADVSPLAVNWLRRIVAARNGEKGVKARHSFDGTTHDHQQGGH